MNSLRLNVYSDITGEIYNFPSVMNITIPLETLQLIHGKLPWTINYLACLIVGLKVPLYNGVLQNKLGKYPWMGIHINT